MVFCFDGMSNNNNMQYTVEASVKKGNSNKQILETENSKLLAKRFHYFVSIVKKKQKFTFQ